MRAPIGRDAEIARLAGAVGRPGCTQLVGPPGVGKTELARWVAKDRGAVWVDFEPVSEAGLEAAIARSLEVPVARDALIGALAEAELLVLDAVEGLEGAVGAWLAELLPECPHLAVLVTSRVRLAGVRVEELEPLGSADAVALFHVEAESVCAGVDLTGESAAIEELVERLDRLPLAVMLAAGKLRLYSPTELLTEEPLEVLADRRMRGRHTSLEGALQVSWALLDAPAQHALARIALVRRWFGRSAFRQITGAPLAVLEQLLDASLVHWVSSDGGRRYHLLEPIRKFALSKLAADDAARIRYVTGVLDRSDELMAKLDSSTGREAVARLRDLTPDLEAVIEAGGDPAARALIPLARLASSQGGTAPLLQTVARLELAKLSDEWAFRTQLLQAELLVRLRRVAEARAVWERLERDDVELEVLRGVAAMREGHPEASVEHLERALRRVEAGEAGVRGTPPEQLRVEILVAFAATYMERGAYDQAIAACEQGISVCAEMDRPDLEGLLLRCLATASRLVSHDAMVPAIARLDRARELFRRTHNQRFEARTLTSLAVLETDLALPSAADRVAEAIPLLRRVGERFSVHRMELLRGLIAMDLDDLDLAEEIFDGLRPTDAKNRVTLACYRGVLFLLRGDVPAGLRALEEGVAGFDALGMQVDRDLAAHFLAVARAEEPPAPHDGRSENLVLANRIVRARAEGLPLEASLLEATSRDVDLRLLVRITRVSGASEVARDGSWFRTDGGRVELGRKRVLKRVLQVFAAHEGRALTTEQILAAAWPGEHTHGNSGRARVHVAVSELRKLGLREALRTAPVDGGTGYLLAARVLS